MPGSFKDRGTSVVYRDKNLHLAGTSHLIRRLPEVFDHFVGDTLDANLWSSVADTGCTAAAINVQVGGVVRLTTDTTDDDRVDFAGEIIWRPSKGLVFETRIKVDDIDPTAICLGLSDAKSEAAQTMAASLSGTTFTTTASNGVFFLYDTDATTDTWRGIGVKADTDSASVNTGLAPVAATWQTFRIEVDTAGNASFLVLDDAQLDAQPLFRGYAADACTDSTLLTPYIAVQNRAGEARNLDIDYVRVVQLSL